jgi:hypothetical protein
MCSCGGSTFDVEAHFSVQFYEAIGLSGLEDFGLF